jgi:TRAP-type C4-dicarboxylate transport system permease small subunit
MTTSEKGHPVEALRSIYGQAMDALYLACVLVAGTALVLISAVIPWAVYTRYVLNQAASWPEPMAVLLTIVLTFFGAAACYRRRLHMNVSFFVAMLPPRLRRIADLIAELLVALFALFMVIWGVKLVDATWYNTIADFPALSVGVTYLPIPLGGAILLLFVIEHVSGGQRTDDGGRRTDIVPANQRSVIRPPSSVL